jgi:hypothetical protein
MSVDIDLPDHYTSSMKSVHFFAIGLLQSSQKESSRVSVNTARLIIGEYLSILPDGSTDIFIFEEEAR